jgi:CRISPR-associated protein (TIGR02710 family)
MDRTASQCVHKLLVCTVGGTLEPIVASILSERPEKVIFVPSPETQAMVSDSILAMLDQKGFQIIPAQYRVVVVPDAEDFETCVRTLRRLEPEANDWLQRGRDFALAVDLTGGTKCMSSALALVAARWRAEFLYVGGGQRNKAGVGVVVSSTEHVLRRANPWDSLGYQAIEDASLLFDRGLYAGAIRVLDEAISRMSRPEVKRELATLKRLAEAYDLWDHFDFNGGQNALADVSKNINDLRHAFPCESQRLEQTLQSHMEHLSKMLEQKPSELLVWDLLANAYRKASQGSYDDAVARLYRAVEAHGQIRLEKQYGLKPRTTTLDVLPEHLHDKWRPRVYDGGFLRLGLRDLYELLRDLGDPLGEDFASSTLAGPESPLETRNNSILAHGFCPVTQKGFQSLWDAVLKLVKAQKNELISFPKLKAD